jgi:ABC-type branched-subunit amino acid transport system ATPase component
MRALEVCDRFLALERGAVVFQGDARSSADRQRLIEVIAV